MKLEEASEAYMDKKCDAIGRNNSNVVLAITNGFLVFKANLLKPYLPKLSEIVDNNWETIKHKSDYEEDEVVRWFHLPTNCSSHHEPLTDFANWVKLTGTTKHEIKLKVKHRKEIWYTGTHGTITFVEKCFGVPDGSKLFAEWEE